MNRRLWILFPVLALTFTVLGASIALPEEGPPAPSSTGNGAASVVAAPKLKKIGAEYPIQFVFYIAQPAQSQVLADNQWEELAEASIKVTVGEKYALIFGRFTTETFCSGGDGFCAARMAYRKLPSGDTKYLQPGVNSTTFLDSTGSDQWETHSIDQVVGKNVGKGNYLVWVELARGPFDGSPSPSFYVQNWTFTAQAAW